MLSFRNSFDKITIAQKNLVFLVGQMYVQYIVLKDTKRNTISFPI